MRNRCFQRISFYAGWHEFRLSRGWAAGAGIEYAVTNNWSIKSEYLYADLGNQSLNEFNPGFPTFTQYSFNDIKISIVRFGLNYRF
jgi:outer membrane immunogenic protein